MSVQRRRLSVIDADGVRLPAYQILADDLRAQITSGRLRPGERLPTEPQLCQRSGVSRSTVREALRLLASQHLVVTTRGVSGGTFVAHPSPKQLADTLSTGMRLLLDTATVSVPTLLEVREMLEVPAAGLAARRRTDGDLAAMEAALVAPGPDIDSLCAAQRDFHSAVAAATGNPLFELLTGPLYRVSNERELAEAAPDGFWQRVDQQHRRILDAVRAGSEKAACAAARAHLGYLRESYPER